MPQRTARREHRGGGLSYSASSPSLSIGSSHYFVGRRLPVREFFCSIHRPSGFPSKRSRPIWPHYYPRSTLRKEFQGSCFSRERGAFIFSMILRAVTLRHSVCPVVQNMLKHAHPCTRARA